MCPNRPVHCAAGVRPRRPLRRARRPIWWPIRRPPSGAMMVAKPRHPGSSMGVRRRSHSGPTCEDVLLRTTVNAPKPPWQCGVRGSSPLSSTQMSRPFSDVEGRFWCQHGGTQGGTTNLWLWILCRMPRGPRPRRRDGRRDRLCGCDRMTDGVTVAAGGGHRRPISQEAPSRRNPFRKARRFAPVSRESDTAGWSPIFLPEGSGHDDAVRRGDHFRPECVATLPTTVLERGGRQPADPPRTVVIR
jgi:hypothetical protein